MKFTVCFGETNYPPRAMQENRDVNGLSQTQSTRTGVCIQPSSVGGGVGVEDDGGCEDGQNGDTAGEGGDQGEDDPEL